MANDEKESLSGAIRKAYNKELARYHSFLLRNTVKAILFLIPSREKFFKAITYDFTDCTEEEIAEHMKTLIENSQVTTAYLLEFMKEREHFELP